MIPRGYGRIINIGSVTSVLGYAGLGPYGASRGGISQLTMSLADDWGPHGITVNCLAPGWFKTKQNAGHVRGRSVGGLPETIAIPLKRRARSRISRAPSSFSPRTPAPTSPARLLLVDGGISAGATRALPRCRRGPRLSTKVTRHEVSAELASSHQHFVPLVPSIDLQQRIAHRHPAVH